MEGVDISGNFVKTQRLSLRLLTLDDTDAIHRVRSNSKNTVHTQIDSEAETPTVTREWIQKVTTTKTPFLFAVVLSFPTSSTATSEDLTNELATTSIVIGMCGTYKIPELGYILDNPYWGKGYATEAVQGFLRLYWAKFPDGYPGVEGDEKDYMIARVNIENVESESILKKCGFSLLREEDQKDEKTGEVKIIREWKLWRPGKP